jgi:hypothetical protein
MHHARACIATTLEKARYYIMFLRFAEFCKRDAKSIKRPYRKRESRKRLFTGFLMIGRHGEGARFRRVPLCPESSVAVAFLVFARKVQAAHAAAVAARFAPLRLAVHLGNLSRKCPNTCSAEHLSRPASQFRTERLSRGRRCDRSR